MIFFFLYLSLDDQHSKLHLQKKLHDFREKSLWNHGKFFFFTIASVFLFPFYDKRMEYFAFSSSFLIANKVLVIEKEAKDKI